ncbi:unnamed protein product [Durusdinium trenchii]|uniref:Tubby C-terminal domain-containing protein n=1 Tax=Durusdinium trenchii TaxID=1381693 RepID=A0ABP0ISK8_9DINO
MGAAIHISPKRQVVYGDYYLPVTMGEDDSPQPSMHSMEVTFSLLSGQSLKLTLSQEPQKIFLVSGIRLFAWDFQPWSLAWCTGSSSIFRYSANLDNGAFHCMNAIKKSGSVGRHFAISIEGLDQYRARIFRPLSNKEYILYDPASHTGAPGEAREMGCLRLRSKRRVGPSDLDFVMPKDGTAAQFRPLALKESISQIYERGSLEHLQILRGTSDVSIELRLHGEAIFEAHPMDKTWAVRFQHPLSHFQAFGILIGVLDNACLASFHK